LLSGQPKTMPKYQNSLFGSIGKERRSCQGHNLEKFPQYCINVPHITAFWIFKIGTWIAVLFTFCPYA
jgi:hypothetical protein